MIGCVLEISDVELYVYCFRMDDILTNPVSQIIIFDNAYHASSDVWERVERVLWSVFM